MPAVADPLALCATAEYRFYQLAYRALGAGTAVVDDVWRVVLDGAGAPAVPPVFPVAGTLGPQAATEAVHAAGVPLLAVVHDHWSALRLTPHGYEAEPGSPWMLREPAPCVVEPVRGLRVRRATTAADVLRVERTVVAAAGGPTATYQEGSIHPGRATAVEADLHLLLGLLDDVPVATAMAAVAPDVVLVTGVATMAAVRGRGIGSVMTSAALGVAADRPAALGTSLLGRHVYERLGFTQVAVPTWWTSGAVVDQS